MCGINSASVDQLRRQGVWNNKNWWEEAISLSPCRGRIEFPSSTLVIINEYRHIGDQDFEECLGADPDVVAVLQSDRTEPRARLTGMLDAKAKLKRQMITESACFSYATSLFSMCAGVLWHDFLQ